ncbi:hypothetical protein PG996_005786 [Apiospora saccharicola]|uniref:Uncharacterized protein n=1 Tax=Apiospora saccharicola TaxID=335842 RepID=A0ABR1VRI0_9PEZI
MPRKGHKGSQDADDLREKLPTRGMCLDSPTAQGLLGRITMPWFARALRGDDPGVRRRHIINKLPELFYDGAAQMAHADAGLERPDVFWKRIVDAYQPWASSIPGAVVLEFVVYLMQARREFLLAYDKANKDESEYVTAIDLFEDNLKRYHGNNRALIAQYKATSRGERDDESFEHADTEYYEFSDDQSAASSSSHPNKKRRRESSVEPTGPPLPQQEQDHVCAGVKRMKLDESVVDTEDVQMGDGDHVVY